MSKELKSNLFKYGITALIGALMAFTTTQTHNLAEAATDAEKYRILSDAFTIPGVILIMVGLLVMVSNGGFFNGMAYAFSYAARLLVPGVSKDVGRYGDFIERRARRGKTGYGFLIIVGAAFLAVAIVFLILFYHC